MSWLSVLGEWLRDLAPLCVVRAYQRGVRFGWGRHVSEVPPGVHLRLLALWDIEVVDVVEQIVETEPQSVTTSDRKNVVVKAAVRYTITDAVKYHTAVQHTDHSILNLCEVHLHRQIRRRTFDAIQRGQGGLERAILRTLVPAAQRWGVEVAAVELTHFVSAKHHALFNRAT